MRKNIELNEVGKQHDQIQKQVWELEKENDKITDNAIKWYKDKQKLIQLYNKIKRQQEYLNDRASIAEENLLINQLEKDFTNGNLELLEMIGEGSEQVGNVTR